jgi:cytochrome c biogenesis protein CcdA
MDSVYKLLLFLLFFICTVLLGLKMYAFLNEKIKSSDSGWQLAGYSLLLFSALGALFMGSLYALVWVYAQLSDQ